MGSHDNIGYYEFPVQNDTIDTHVGVVQVGEQGSTTELGQIKRDDLLSPLATIIELEDGTIVLGDEKDGFTKPKQGTWLGLRVEVCFNRDTAKLLEGSIVRDDEEEPFATIIKLDLGRYVSSKECQYSLIG